MMAAAQHQEQINHITGDVHYLVLGLCQKQTVLTVHDCASLERLRGWRLLVFRKLWYEWPIRRAALVTVISESTRCELLRHVRCDPTKIRVVVNCVSNDFLPSPRPFNESNPEILHLGTATNKNLERLVVALKGLACRLHIIGRLTPTHKEALERYKVSYVNTPRATDRELVMAFQRCDLVAFVSTYEGFGLPIVEANATGRPVVTSNLLSMPEVAGNAACLVDPFDVESIRLGVLRVWNDAHYRQKLVDAGFANVKRFSVDAVAAEYAAIYKELAARGKTVGSN